MSIKSYWRHPLLWNPGRWLNKRRFIGVKNYRVQKEIPSIESLEANPFTQALINDTAMDAGTRLVFPRGSMVRLTMDARPDSGANNKESMKYFLTPIIDDPPIPLRFSRSYILRNYFYIKYHSMVGTWRKFIPYQFHFKNKSSKISNSKFGVIPKVHDQIGKLYMNKVLQGIQTSDVETIERSNLKDFKGDGLVIDLDISANESGYLHFINGTPIISLNGLPTEFQMELINELKPNDLIFFPNSYKNMNLTANLVTLFNYYN
ncbi:hypothetical protein CAAN3_26S00694 [[Candida] anglica]